MRTHVLLSLIGIILLLVVQPPLPWTLSVIVLVIAGLAAELANSALEAALDKLHPGIDPTIGAAKEMASGAAAAINLATVALFLGAVLAAVT